MNKIKKLFTNTRIIILLVFILLSVVAINPRFSDDGVAIRSIMKDSAASIATPTPFLSPEAGGNPRGREILYEINGRSIDSPEEYYSFMNELEPEMELVVVTSKGRYRVTTLPEVETIVLNETEEQEVTREIFDEELNTTINITETIVVNKTITNVVGTQDIGLQVYDVPQNNIRKGLDLEGGTRVLLQVQDEVNDEDLDLVIENIRQRLNVYGVSDVIVRSVKDFTGEVYVLVEIAGASQEEVNDLLSKQGKFEAKIGEAIVFRGGNDITYVCRSAQCSGIDPQYGCSRTGLTGADAWSCRFRFQIALSQEAARAQADATRNLDVLYEGVTSEGYLSQNLSLFLDDDLVDELRIGSTLKGNAVTDIVISGSGNGVTQQAAAQSALDNMRQLQTVLVTGSLPVRLEIIQSDAISPVLGEEFVKNALLVGGLAILGVVVVIVIRYKKLVIAVPAVIAMLSEVLILMGFASLIGWRLDLAAIAGIIIAVGTGVDDQIIIIDETLSRKKFARALSWKDKLKRAFFIIMTAYFTTVVAMLPLWTSGAGLLKGFALTTIAGVTIGVLLTRPAFATILETLLDRNKEEEVED